MLQPSADATLSCAFVKRIKSTQTLLLYTLPEDWTRKRELEGSHSIRERGSGTVVERRAVGEGWRGRWQEEKEEKRKGEGGIMGIMVLVKPSHGINSIQAEEPPGGSMAGKGTERINSA